MPQERLNLGRIVEGGWVEYELVGAEIGVLPGGIGVDLGGERQEADFQPAQLCRALYLSGGLVQAFQVFG